MTAFVFFIFKWAGEEEGWFEGDSTWLIHYKKTKKIVISDPLLYRRPLSLRQLKNNQNQTNTTEAQNLKEFNNTAGCLSVFFVFCF
jgi:hypothetical protein